MLHSCSLFLFINSNLKHVSDSHFEEEDEEESHLRREREKKHKHNEGIAVVETSNREKLERQG
jgi:hypothetical protein